MRGGRPDAALERTIREIPLAADETIVAAVSGGPDSVALATLLAGAASEAGATLVLGHVNHGLRASAWQDEAVVLALGAALRLRVRSVLLEAGSSAEERLRDERYEALTEIARDAGARRVFAARHA
ncbi:MAG: tRNA(Ile)-lysidine synthetase, partial [Candidatus Eremiobacteraeota bacterium]|nr:tRNA(Ile)-lysidine synthetase [Candidatus Eremiobacteraeota bacterium]